MPPAGPMGDGPQSDPTMTLPKDGTSKLKPVLTMTRPVDAETAENICNDTKQRRAAYGRLETACKTAAKLSGASGTGEQALAIYCGLDKLTGDKSAKKREFLKKWLMDPTFVTAVVECKCFVEHITESGEHTRALTRPQLERGTKETKEDEKGQQY